ncbi:MAG: hypothetical protein V1866_01645 [archaeon]
MANEIGKLVAKEARPTRGRNSFIIAGVEDAHLFSSLYDPERSFDHSDMDDVRKSLKARNVEIKGLSHYVSYFGMPANHKPPILNIFYVRLISPGFTIPDLNDGDGLDEPQFFEVQHALNYMSHLLPQYMRMGKGAPHVLITQPKRVENMARFIKMQLGYNPITLGEIAKPN